MLTIERLKALLQYDPATGYFNWKVKRRGVTPGRPAGYVSKGYRYVSIDGRTYLSHRLAWFYMKGVFPKGQVDHKNRCKDDNRWDNLREANNAQQAMNTDMRVNNTSGYRGVYYYKGKWVAMLGRKYVAIGKNIGPVAAAYEKAAREKFGEFIPQDAAAAPRR